MNSHPDFEVEIHFLRKTPVRQGYYPTFKYLDDPPNRGWMMNSRFLDKEGNELPPDVPITGTVRAAMCSVYEKSRLIHQDRIKVGVQFQFVEGYDVVAKGVVTKIIGLHDPITDSRT